MFSITTQHVQNRFTKQVGINSHLFFDNVLLKRMINIPQEGNYVLSSFETSFQDSEKFLKSLGELENISSGEELDRFFDENKISCKILYAYEKESFDYFMKVLLELSKESKKVFCVPNIEITVKKEETAIVYSLAESSKKRLEKIHGPQWKSCELRFGLLYERGQYLPKQIAGLLMGLPDDSPEVRDAEFHAILGIVKTIE